MGLMERLNAPQQRRGGKVKCRIAVHLMDMTEKEAAEVVRIMDSIANLEGKYTASWLSTQLRKEGYVANHATILRHARKECCCYVD